MKSKEAKVISFMEYAIKKRLAPILKDSNIPFEIDVKIQGEYSLDDFEKDIEITEKILASIPEDFE